MNSNLDLEQPYQYDHAEYSWKILEDKVSIVAEVDVFPESVVGT